VDRADPAESALVVWAAKPTRSRQAAGNGGAASQVLVILTVVVPGSPDASHQTIPATCAD
jgi:hypothetical protein